MRAEAENMSTYWINYACGLGSGCDFEKGNA